MTDAAKGGAQKVLQTAVLTCVPLLVTGVAAQFMMIAENSQRIAVMEGSRFTSHDALRIQESINVMTQSVVRSEEKLGALEERLRDLRDQVRELKAGK